MKRFKYPAPFDPPDPGPISPVGAPIAPGPPLPIDIPGVDLKKRQPPSLYRDLFGDDLSVVAEALDSSWVDADQQKLVQDLLNGKKSIVDLDSVDRELLGDLAHRYVEDRHAPVRQTISEGLPLLDRVGDRREESQRVQPEERPIVSPGDPSDLAGAYGWLRDEEGSE